MSGLDSCSMVRGIGRLFRKKTLCFILCDIKWSWKTMYVSWKSAGKVLEFTKDHCVRTLNCSICNRTLILTLTTVHLLLTQTTDRQMCPPPPRRLPQTCQSLIWITCQTSLSLTVNQGRGGTWSGHLVVLCSRGKGLMIPSGCWWQGWRWTSKRSSPLSNRPRPLCSSLTCSSSLCHTYCFACLGWLQMIYNGQL